MRDDWSQWDGHKITESEPLRGRVTPWECLRRRVKTKVLPLLQKTPTLPRNVQLHIQRESADNLNVFRLALKFPGTLGTSPCRICPLFGGAAARARCRFSLLARSRNVIITSSLHWSHARAKNTRWVKLKFCCVMEPTQPEMTVIHTAGSF